MNIHVFEMYFCYYPADTNSYLVKIVLVLLGVSMSYVIIA